MNILRTLPRVLIMALLTALAVAAQDPSLVLSDGGIEFPDGSVLTSAGGSYRQVFVVAKSGGHFTSIQDALDATVVGGTEPGPDSPFLIWIAPGVYEENITMKPWVDIQGSGESKTKITSDFLATVAGANHAELRFLTVINKGQGPAIANHRASPRLTHVTAIVSGGRLENFAVRNHTNSSPTMTHVRAIASGGQYSAGVYNWASSSPTMTFVTATGSGASGLSDGILNGDGSSPTMTYVTATGSGAPENYGIRNFDSSASMSHVTARAIGDSSENIGVYNYDSNPTMVHVTAIASGGVTGGGGFNYGVWNRAGSVPTMTDVVARASGGYESWGVYNDVDASAVIRGSLLEGATAIRSVNEVTPVQVIHSQLIGGAHGTRPAYECFSVCNAILRALDGDCR